MKIALIIILAVFAKYVFASDVELPEMTEDCVHEAYDEFVESSGMARIQFDSVVTDAGGYGVYKTFSLKAAPPFIGRLDYDGSQITVSPEGSSMSELAVLIAEICRKAANK